MTEQTKHTPEREGWDLSTRSQQEVVTFGLYLALTAPTEEKAQEAARNTAKAALGMTEQQVKEAKADALLLLDIPSEKVLAALTGQEVTP